MGRWCLASLLALGLVLAAACVQDRATSALPKGAWLYGDAASFRAILESLESWRDTPMADVAHRLREQIAECVDVVAHSNTTDLANLLEHTRCAESADVPESIAALRGGRAAGFAVEVSPNTHLTGVLVRNTDGSLAIEAMVATPDAANLAALLVPSEKPPGPPALSEVETLMHARVRPASGLNIASLVSEDSQADNMFRLRSELFLGQVLAGTWEIAIYLPRKDQVTPPMALALDYTLRPAAKAAMEAFVSELESTWPIHHSEATSAGFEGACFHDVKLLPDLAPCYVLTDRSIVVGWNATSLELALGHNVSAFSLADATFEPNASIGDDGGLVIHLDRLPEADLRLQKQLMGDAQGRKIDYVWDELRMQGTSDGNMLEVRVSLEMDGAS